jgi:hypothetical protein
MHVYTLEADFMHAIAFVINFSIFRELYISQINSKYLLKFNTSSKYAYLSVPPII